MAATIPLRPGEVTGIVSIKQAPCHFANENRDAGNHLEVRSRSNNPIRDLELMSKVGIGRVASPRSKVALENGPADGSIAEAFPLSIPSAIAFSKIV